MPYEAIGLSLSNQFLMMPPPKPPNFEARDAATKTLYSGNEPLYIGYTQTYADFRQQQNFSEFRDQYLKLIESFKDWCKNNVPELDQEMVLDDDNKTRISKLEKNFKALTNNLFNTQKKGTKEWDKHEAMIAGYFGANPQACYEDMKKQIESIHFMLNSDGIQQGIKQGAVRDLISNNKISYCPGGTTQYIADLARTLSGGSLLYDTKYRMLQDSASNYAAEILISIQRQLIERGQRTGLDYAGIHVHSVIRLLNHIRGQYGIPYTEDHYQLNDNVVRIQPEQFTHFEKMARECSQIINFLPRFDEFGIALVNEAVERLNKADENEIGRILDEFSEKFQELGGDSSFGFSAFLDNEDEEKEGGEVVKYVFKAKPTEELLGALHATILSRLIQSKQINVTVDFSREVTPWLPMSNHPFTVAILSKSKIDDSIKVTSLCFTDYSSTVKKLIEENNYAELGTYLGIACTSENARKEWFEPLVKELLNQPNLPKPFVDNLDIIGLISYQSPVLANKITESLLTGQAFSKVISETTDDAGMTALHYLATSQSGQHQIEKILQNSDADLQKPNNKGQMPLQMAIESNRSENVIALIKYNKKPLDNSLIEKVFNFFMQNEDFSHWISKDEVESRKKSTEEFINRIVFNISSVSFDELITFLSKQDQRNLPIYMKLLKIKNIIEADPKTAVAKLGAVLNLIKPATESEWSEFLQDNDLHVASLVQTEDIVSSNNNRDTRGESLGGYINLPVTSSKQAKVFNSILTIEDWSVLLFKDKNRRINFFEKIDNQNDARALLESLIPAIKKQRDALLSQSDKTEDQDAITKLFYGVIFTLVAQVGGSTEGIDTEGYWQCIKVIRDKIGNDEFAETMKYAGDYETAELFLHISRKNWDEFINSLITEKSSLKEDIGGLLNPFFQYKQCWQWTDGDVFAQFLDIVKSKIEDEHFFVSIFKTIEDVINAFKRLDFSHNGQKTDRQQNTKNYLFDLLFEKKIKEGIKSFDQLFNWAPLLSKHAQLKLIDSLMPDILTKMNAKKVKDYFGNVAEFNKFIKNFDQANRFKVFNALATKFPLSVILSSSEGKKNFKEFIKLFPQNEQRNAARLYSSSANPIDGWEPAERLSDNIKKILLPHSASWISLRSTDRKKEHAIIDTVTQCSEDREKIISVLEKELYQIAQAQKDMSFSNLEMRLMCCIDNISKMQPAASADMRPAKEKNDSSSSTPQSMHQGMHQGMRQG